MGTERIESEREMMKRVRRQKMRRTTNGRMQRAWMMRQLRLRPTCSDATPDQAPPFALAEAATAGPEEASWLLKLTSAADAAAAIAERSAAPTR